MAGKKKRKKGTQRTDGPKYVPKPIEAVGPEFLPAPRDQLLLDVFGSHLGALLDDACSGLTNMARRGSIHSLVALGRADEFGLHVREFVERADDDVADAVERAILTWDRREFQRLATLQHGPDSLLPDGQSSTSPTLEPRRSAERGSVVFVPVLASSPLEQALGKPESWPHRRSLVLQVIRDGVVVHGSSTDYYRTQAAELAEKLGRDLAEFVASTTIGELLEHLTLDAESGDLGVMPREGPEPGPETEADVDDADLFQRAVSRSLETIGTGVFPDAQARASEGVTGLLGRLSELRADHDSAFRLVRDVAHVVDEPIVIALQAYLRGLEGRSFGSLEANRSFARTLNEALDALDSGIQCPTCGEPGRLYVKPGTSPDGAFTVRHPDRSMHSGRATLPRLSVVPRQG